MRLHIHSPAVGGGAGDGEAVRARCERLFLMALARFAVRLEGVRVRLAPLPVRARGPRVPGDVRVQVRVRLRGGRQLLLAVEDASLEAAVDRAAHRARRAVERALDAPGP
jgi:hypothetical protein